MKLPKKKFDPAQIAHAELSDVLLLCAMEGMPISRAYPVGPLIMTGNLSKQRFPLEQTGGFRLPDSKKVGYYMDIIWILHDEGVENSEILHVKLYLSF